MLDAPPMGTKTVLTETFIFGLPFFTIPQKVLLGGLPAPPKRE